MMDLAARVLDLAIQIQQIAAPTFHEQARAEFVRERFQVEQLSNVSIDSTGNVYGRLRGGETGKRALVVSAHLDTVFPSSINLEVRRESGKIIAPGIGDNSLGVASLLGLVWAVRERMPDLGHDLWLAANVGEEGLGNLRGMRAVVDRFKGDVRGYLILEGLALGHIYHRAVGVQRYRIHVQTPGGHSWSDYGRPSAVHELASLITNLTSIQLPVEPRTTMNVGTISGGTGVNVLASDAACELDLRSEDPQELSMVSKQVEKRVSKYNHADVKIEMELIGQRPAGQIPAAHPLVEAAVESTKACGIDAVLTNGSTDANIPLSKAIPAVVMGITTGGGAHTTHEYINVDPIETGLESVVGFVERVKAL